MQAENVQIFYKKKKGKKICINMENICNWKWSDIADYKNLCVLWLQLRKLKIGMEVQ